jgi:hypothetical protein
MSGDTQKLSPFASAQLPLLQTLPVPLAAIMMQQIARAGRLFPIELRELNQTLQSLTSPRQPSTEQAVQLFAKLRLSPEMQRVDWRTDPAGFVERMTTELWGSSQIGDLREAAKLLMPSASISTTPASKPARFVVIVLDQDLSSATQPPTLFRKLRPHGTFFPNVKDQQGTKTLTEWIASRAAAHPEPYAHWQLSGARAAETSPAPVVYLSYEDLQNTRQRLLTRFNTARNTAAAGGPEGLRQALLYLTPEQLGLASIKDPVLQTFTMDIFTEGSGTQLYATTFVQWTIREALRRAQPRTLLARFTPRSEATSMDLRFTHPELEPSPDKTGSLVDAEMGSYLSYLNLKRLPDATDANFLVWHEGYGQALLIGSGMPAGSNSPSVMTIKSLLSLTT